MYLGDGKSFDRDKVIHHHLVTVCTQSWYLDWLCMHVALRQAQQTPMQRALCLICTIVDLHCYMVPGYLASLRQAYLHAYSGTTWLQTTHSINLISPVEQRIEQCIEQR